MSTNCKSSAIICILNVTVYNLTFVRTERNEKLVGKSGKGPGYTHAVCPEPVDTTDT